MIPIIDALPEVVLLEILGNRKKVLFVEGDKGSLDYAIYQSIYPDFIVVPRGSCIKVIESTKALRDNRSLHQLEVYGIIDRDYRPDLELSALSESGIYCVSVAEIENILCVPEVIEVVCQHLELPFEVKIREATNLMIKALVDEFETQVANRTLSEIKFELGLFNSKETQKNDLEQALHNFVTDIDVDNIYRSNEELFNSIIDNYDYVKALSNYNRKSILRRQSAIFGLAPGEYGSLVLRLLKSSKKDTITNALKKYSPSL